MNATGKDLPYRPCVGIMVFNASGLIWVGSRIDGSGARTADRQYWQMPQGGIDEGEGSEVAARRELYEETNIRSITLHGQSRNWLKYDLPKALMGKALWGRYRGQTQKWFLASFGGDDAEVDVNRPGGGQYKPEFSTWKWVGINELSGLTVPFKCAVYNEIAEEFGPLIEGVIGGTMPQR